MYFTAQLCHHRMFSEQLFQLLLKKICGNVQVQYSSKAQLKQLFRNHPMMIQRRSETHSTSLCQYDLILFRRRHMAQLRNGITIRFVLLAIGFLQNDLICPTGRQLFAIRSDMFRHRLLAHRRSEATGTFLCITIRFVLRLKTIFCYMICPAANSSFSLRYDLSYWQSTFCNTI